MPQSNQNGRIVNDVLHLCQLNIMGNYANIFSARKGNTLEPVALPDFKKFRQRDRPRSAKGALTAVGGKLVQE